MALPASAISAAALIACTGGGSQSNYDYQRTQDPVDRSNESVASSTEAVGRSNEAVRPTNENGGNGGGSVAGFTCSGTFRCTATVDVPGVGQRPVNSTIRFPGTCTTDQGGLNPDGTVVSNGNVIATWQPSGGGNFTYTTTQQVEGGGSVTYTAQCNKISDAITDDDDDDDDDDSPPVPG